MFASLVDTIRSTTTYHGILDWVLQLIGTLGHLCFFVWGAAQRGRVAPFVKSDDKAKVVPVVDGGLQLLPLRSTAKQKYCWNFCTNIANWPHFHCQAEYCWNFCTNIANWPHFQCQAEMFLHKYYNLTLLSMSSRNIAEISAIIANCSNLFRIWSCPPRAGPRIQLRTSKTCFNTRTLFPLHQLVNLKSKPKKCCQCFISIRWIKDSNDNL